MQYPVLGPRPRRAQERPKLAHLLFIWMCVTLCGSASAQPTDFVLTLPTNGVDAEKTLGCKSGFNPVFRSGNNATRLTAALNSKSLKYPPLIPGGDWEIPQTIIFPASWGASLFGAGGVAGDIGDAHFPSLRGSPQVTRLIWTGKNDGTMIQLNSAGSQIAGMKLQGCRVAGSGPEPSGGVYPNRAKIGLHINTSDNGAINTAKCRLSHLLFAQFHTCILVGKNLDDPGASKYDGMSSTHADSIFADNLTFVFPFSGPHAGVGTGLHIRNDQSLANEIGAIYCGGRPEQCVWLERGGDMHIGMLSLTGSSGYAIRVGIIDSNQGGLIVDHVSLDAIAGTESLIKGDVYSSSIATPYVEIRSAKIPPAIKHVPQIDVGPGTYVIRNCNYLRAGSIKMTGVSIGGSDRICHVMLDNVTTLDCNIDELVDPNSSGPYLLTWQNCHRFHTGNRPKSDWGLPFEDSTPETEISNGVKRLPFNGK